MPDAAGLGEAPLPPASGVQEKHSAVGIAALAQVSGHRAAEVLGGLPGYPGQRFSGGGGRSYRRAFQDERVIVGECPVEQGEVGGRPGL
nr:hypothetical protein [Fodinicola feengrottensis]